MVTKSPAADLRASSRKVFELGLILALVLVIAAFKFFPDVRKVRPVETTIDEPPIIIVPPTKQPEKPPPPPPRPPVVIEAPADEVLPDVKIDTDLHLGADIPPPPPPPDPDEQWFEAVEEPPVPVGGIAALQRNLVYPAMAVRAGIEGTVVVLAYVEKDGSVSKTEVLKGIGLGCDEAAVKAVEKTKFIPGLQRDQPVRVKIKLSLKFKLTR